MVIVVLITAAGFIMEIGALNRIPHILFSAPDHLTGLVSHYFRGLTLQSQSNQVSPS